MNILVINCGSSSLKYQLINSDTEAVLAKGLCERIGIWLLPVDGGGEVTKQAYREGEELGRILSDFDVVLFRNTVLEHLGL